MLERLQKILSARGIASRRKAEEYILAGLVTVNGTKAILGQKADPEVDTIEVDGKVMTDRQDMLYYVLNKPKGIVTTNASSADDKTVGDWLPEGLRGKVFPVGRLDKDSVGLLLLTNDGVLAYRLTHPKFEHEKEYEVTTKDEMFPGALRKIEEGVKIDDALTKPAKIKRLDAHRFRITLTEGRNRQIRRMVQKVGGEVIELKRIRIVTLEDSALAEGKMRKLTPEEVVELQKGVGLIDN